MTEINHLCPRCHNVCTCNGTLCLHCCQPVQTNIEWETHGFLEVSYQECERLRADNARLTAEVLRCAEGWRKDDEEIVRLTAELAAAKALLRECIYTDMMPNETYVKVIALIGEDNQ